MGTEGEGDETQRHSGQEEDKLERYTVRGKSWTENVVKQGSARRRANEYFSQKQ